MNAEKIKELRGLVAAATAGPWSTDDYTIHDPTGKSWTAGSKSLKDAALIVAAVNSLPALLDEVEALRAALKPLAGLDLRPGQFESLADTQVVYARDNTTITVGDVRRARELTARHEPKDAEHD